jgi:hypothetical protein
VKEAMIMGKVRMSGDNQVRIPGIYEPIVDIFEYTYCDKCGSFSIEQRKRPYFKGLIAVRVIAIIFVVSLVVSVRIVMDNWFNSCLTGLIGLIGWIILIGIAPLGYLKCRKCGNEHITEANVLHYSFNDSSVLDVPDNLAMKQFIGSETI